ncbi:transcriptional regulator [Levilactobacillus paucivorans]|uniref:Transcriptional regulator n=1 Tax=Levilactobacillus paucivorans TaxID=616990 RepID=A0A0R2LZ75_9LACO|nr:LysR family transcriptional regulator [Levilactobacillus paucivorans]KRO04493.1 transcriptional regulator [Levilactobacillus paucivorans]
MLDNRYQTFLVLATTRSYTQTAQQLYITQPAVSQQIKSLEAELGVTLVTYRRPHLTITLAGRELADLVQRVQVQTDKVLDHLKHPRTPKHLTFSTTLSLSEFLAPQLIGHLQQAGPYQEITCRVTNTQAALAALTTGASDFALIEGNFDKSQYDYQVVRQEPFVGVVAADHPLAALPTVSWTDLLNYPLIIRETGSGSREILRHLAAAANVSFAEFPQIVTVNNPTAIRELVAQGSGISFVYRSVVATAIARGDLHVLPLEAGQLKHDLDLVYPHDSYLAGAYQSWGEWLRGQQG